MVHIAGSTIFGHILNPTPFTGSTEQSAATQRFVAQDQIADVIASGISPTIIQDTINKIAATSRLLSFDVQTQVQQNLLGLGEASIDISQALNEQITIREQQRARDQEALRNQALLTESINQRLSQQVTQLGTSLTDLSKVSQTGFNPLKFLTDNPLIGGIGIGGLAVGAVVLLLVLRR